MGVDPGTTTGLAVFDLEGNLIASKSKRHFRASEIRNFIIRHGKPLVMASDMNPLPRSIQKLASSFSSRVIYPDAQLTKKDKRKISGSFLKEWKDYENLPWKNQHEKDALVAGWYAWKKVKRIAIKNRKNPEQAILNGKAGDRLK